MISSAQEPSEAAFAGPRLLALIAGSGSPSSAFLDVVESVVTAWTLVVID